MLECFLFFSFFFVGELMIRILPIDDDNYQSEKKVNNSMANNDTIIDIAKRLSVLKNEGELIIKPFHSGMII